MLRQPNVFHASNMSNDNRPLIVITARAGSKRLPGKVLRPFWKNWSLLEFLIRRLQSSEITSHLVLATVDNPENDPVAHVGLACGIKVVRGPEEDVLGRMGLCLEGEEPAFVARVTADNPFTDPALFELQLEAMKVCNADYSYCRLSPKGTAADIWTISCFRSTLENAATPYQHEHANAWVWDHPNDYNILWFEPPEEFVDNNLNLSIDTEEDFSSATDRLNLLTTPLDAYSNLLMAQHIK